MNIVRTIADLRGEIARWRVAGQSIALVPTMGALHAGHIALVGAALSIADQVVVSIFVNPTQFAPNEDLARYPRDEAGDVAKLAGAGAHLVWAPNVAEMYPPGFATQVAVGGAALPLEGEFRPHHFGGVATVVCKLLSSVTPNIALFGEKDFQQLAVIRQMVRDLALPVAIHGVPTVREEDGLALSSRNAYLSEDERYIAPMLYKVITDVARGRDPDEAGQALLAAGFAKLDYIAVRDAETLGPFQPGTGRPGRVLAAVWLGKTRLIDNVSC
ncbi:pantoate--beta-alanine ligase [Hyphomicrobium sp. LHD-15]|uniref:pantoate--beta-alanine ligase n=1 Tax=Hyphomicrobium sp. LHD-15 TaxID=3072142 RepID=UPI00280DDA48|nr:pantoate--beta-alanine ligase [Hyphomicrobium sp. LHD-15]MDQ8697809.1 pantoate--beta-alanine ligase [Hyphomicrobium sp. LHD-15]